MIVDNLTKKMNLNRAKWKEIQPTQKFWDRLSVLAGCCIWTSDMGPKCVSIWKCQIRKTSKN